MVCNIVTFHDVLLQDRSPGDHAYRKRGHRRMQTTRKVGCHAKVFIKELVHFPSFKVCAMLTVKEYLHMFIRIYTVS